jgi:hypothetical protein
MKFFNEYTHSYGRGQVFEWVNRLLPTFLNFAPTIIVQHSFVEEISFLLSDGLGLKVMPCILYDRTKGGKINCFESVNVADVGILT